MKGFGMIMSLPYGRPWGRDISKVRFPVFYPFV